MTFENLQNTQGCNCLQGAVPDVDNSFYRKLKNEMASIDDFRTHFERRIGTDEQNCERLCSYKAVSINIRKAEYEALILDKYRTTFKFNPKKGAHCLVFRLRDESGLVKPTPEEDDESHYSFFKSDAFSLDHIDVVDTIKYA
jgi:hypothetical protein